MGNELGGSPAGFGILHEPHGRLMLHERYPWKLDLQSGQQGSVATDDSDAVARFDDLFEQQSREVAPWNNRQAYAAPFRQPRPP